MPKRPPPFMDPATRTRARSSKPTSTDPTWAGPVVLVKSADVAPGAPSDPYAQASERYATVSGLAGSTVSVQWDGASDAEAVHSFHRETGLCLESHKGVMRGWSIAAHEMPRFAPVPRA